jgi:hypothetical protein
MQASGNEGYEPDRTIAVDKLVSIGSEYVLQLNAFALPLGGGVGA